VKKQLPWLKDTCQVMKSYEKLSRSPLRKYRARGSLCDHSSFMCAERRLARRLFFHLDGGRAVCVVVVHSGQLPALQGGRKGCARRKYATELGITGRLLKAD
jgi:hypothetical protein